LKLQFLLFITVLGLASLTKAQNISINQGSAFIYWGYNVSGYTTSNISFSGNGYSFWLKDVKATDRPSKFTAEGYFNPSKITTPQYNIRIGYNFKNRFALTLGMDHMKYVIVGNQTVIANGHIAIEDSTQYNANFNNTPIKIGNDFLKFEHSDGLNYVSIDLEYSLPLLALFNNMLQIDWVSGFGAGLLMPKTEVHLFKKGVNNKFHLSGVGYSAKTGFKFTIFSNFFLLAQFKGGYFTMPDVLIDENSNNRAKHNFGFGEYYGALGYQFKFIQKRERAIVPF